MDDKQIDDLEQIKKYYGEKMKHLCRSLFPTLLETKGLLIGLMLKTFEPSRFLYEDLVKNNVVGDFKNFIYSFVEKKQQGKIVTNKTPCELLDEAGYILYECKTEEDIQRFKKYYAPGEALCTFNGCRLYTCDVFFAVKKNVEEIKRENFRNPRREDEYGTSVISIQFSKGLPNTLSIKNRYNHIVENSDNTFNNDLDNIIPGLNNSFEKKYGYNFEVYYSGLEIPGYVKVDGKYYKYNFEKDNIYYCPSNIIIDNFRVIDKYAKEPERYIVFDGFIIDLEGDEVIEGGKPKKKKTITTYHGDDGFIKEFWKNEQSIIDKVIVTKDKETGKKTLEIYYDSNKKAKIVINEMNQLIEYYNDYLTEMTSSFLREAVFLTYIELNNVEKMGDGCLLYAPKLETFIANKLKEMGKNCLSHVTSLRSVEVDSLEKLGDRCLNFAPNLRIFIAKKLTEMGNLCLNRVEALKNIELDSLEKMGYCCLNIANNLETFIAKKLTGMGEGCLGEVASLISVELDSLEIMGDACLNIAHNLETFIAKKLTRMGNDCLSEVDSLTSIELDSLEVMGDGCLTWAKNLETFVAKKLTKMGSECLCVVTSLISVELDSLEVMGDGCLNWANNLETFIAKKLIGMGSECLCDVASLISVELDSLEVMGDCCFSACDNLEKITANNLKEIGQDVFEESKFKPKYREDGTISFELEMPIDELETQVNKGRRSR